MRNHAKIPAILLLSAFAACTRTSVPQVAILEKRNDASFRIVPPEPTGTPGRDDWELQYPVFSFSIANIDGKGEKDIVAGVIKKTRFDSVLRKRIFIFKKTEGKIRPLWLGARVGQPLRDFCIIARNNNTDIVRTVESEKDGTYLSADYEWKGFGLSFICYNARNSDSVTVYQHLDRQL